MACPSSGTSPRSSVARAKQWRSSPAEKNPPRALHCLQQARDPALSVCSGTCHGCTRADGEGPHLSSEEAMPLYVIERSIPDGLGLAPTQQGRQAASTVIGNN